jgi:hypothetical protein
MTAATKNVLGIPLILLILCAVPARAQTELQFYMGPIVVQRIGGTLALRRAGPPTGPLAVKVRNPSRRPTVSRVGFRGSKPATVSLKPGGTRVLALVPVMEHASDKEGGVQQVRIDLLLEIDGRPANEPVGNVNVLILLPRGVPALVRSSMPLVAAQPRRTGRTPATPPGAGWIPRVDEGQGPDDGRSSPLAGKLPLPGRVRHRAAYGLVRQQAYPTELNLVYTTAGVTLGMTKTISPTAIDKGPVAITLEIRNYGPDSAVDVLVQDTFDPRDFSVAPGQIGTFQSYGEGGTDPRLLWFWKPPAVIPVGGTVRVDYSVNAQASVRSCMLNAATATIGGHLVGVSNKITLGP